MTNTPHASSAEQPTSLDALFPGDSELAALMRATDWSRTALGSPQTWPQSLRTIVRMLLTSRYQMWMGWGPQLHFFYNDAYRPTLGAKHPDALGRPTRELWAEIWGDIGPRIQHVLDTGEATWDDGLLLLLERNGYPEETYHTFSYSPLFDDAGAIGGMLSVVMEETERVISERRLALIRELSSHLATAKTVDAVMRAIERACPVADRDLPFTLTYLFDEDMRTATLAARTGDWVDGSAADAAALDLTSPGLWPIGDAIRAGAGVVFEPLPDGIEWPRAPARPSSRRSPNTGSRARRACSSPASTRIDRAIAPTAAFSTCSSDRSPPAWATRARTNRRSAAPKRWPRSTGPRRCSSRTSATNSVRR